MANFMIVVLHAWGAACQYCDPSTLEYGVWTYLGVNSVLALYALFLLSGYLFFKGFALARWSGKLARRIRRLVVPYVCWNVVFVLFYLAVARIFPRIQSRVDSFGLTTWQGAVSKIVGLLERPIDYPVWYMRAIFVFALLAPVLWLALRSRVGRWVGLAVVGAFWVATDVLGWIPDVEAYHAYALLLFYGGGLLAVCGTEGLRGRGANGLLWAIGLGGFAFDLVEHLGWGSWLCFNGRMMMKMVLFLMLADCFGLRGSASDAPAPRRTSRVLGPSILGFSFFVYCGHVLFCSMWVHVLGPMLGAMGTGKMTLLMFAFVVPGLATVGSVYWLGRRFCPRLLRLFDGTL